MVNKKFMLANPEQTYHKYSLKERIITFWDDLIIETRYRVSSSLSFSVLIHIFLILGYFSITSLDRPVEPPIREINFIDMNEVEKKPEEVIKQKKPRVQPRVVQVQPEQQPEIVTGAPKQTSAPIALGNDRIFLDSPRKQAPISMSQVEPLSDNVNKGGDVLNVSPAIGIKKDDRISKPQALDLGKGSDMLIASAGQNQGAVSFGQTGKPQIDLQPGQVVSGPVEAVASDFAPAQPAAKKEEPLVKPRETQTIITGALANRKIVEKVIPPFPKWAKRQGVGATISLQFTVMEDGTVKENVIIQRTSGSLQWDQMVIAALKNWKFVPLPGKGLRQDQTGVITFQFVI
jgi:TonB family protein